MARFAFDPAAAALPSAAQLAPVILAAPAWCRVGLTAPSERMRAEAALELAQVLVEQLEHPALPYDARQLALPI